jgi:hypothetical protein
MSELLKLTPSSSLHNAYLSTIVVGPKAYCPAKAARAVESIFKIGS